MEFFEWGRPEPSPGYWLIFLVKVELAVNAHLCSEGVFHEAAGDVVAEVEHAAEVHHFLSVEEGATAFVVGPLGVVAQLNSLSVNLNYEVVFAVAQEGAQGGGEPPIFAESGFCCHCCGDFGVMVSVGRGGGGCVP